MSKTKRERGTGSIECRATNIRLNFNYKGKRYKENLNLRPELAAHVSIAEKTLARLVKEIENDTFDFATYFPKSKHVKVMKVDASKMTSLEDACDAYLETVGQLAAATRSQYRLALNFWKDAFGAATMIESISHNQIARFVGKHPWKSMKLRNNYLIPLRGVFKFAGRSWGLEKFENPLDGIQNMKHQKPSPSPLSTRDVDRILAYMREHYDMRVANYFTFAVLTGLRPEEQIALRWTDINWPDLHSKAQHGVTITVSRAKTFKGGMKEVKTHSSRPIDIIGPALAVLMSQKKFQRVDLLEIFENPNTSRAWHDDRSQRDHYWTPALKALGIKKHRAYATRHTYATTALMAGLPPAYIARQMGHSVQMLLSTYTRWIDGADKGVQRAKLEQAFTGKYSGDETDTVDK